VNVDFWVRPGSKGSAAFGQDVMRLLVVLHDGGHACQKAAPPSPDSTSMHRLVIVLSMSQRILVYHD
jgi:hypothetical protein